MRHARPGLEQRDLGLGAGSSFAARLAEVLGRRAHVAALRRRVSANQVFLVLRSQVMNRQVRRQGSAGRSFSMKLMFSDTVL